MKIHAPQDKFEVVSWMYEMRFVAKSCGRLTKKKYILSVALKRHEHITHHHLGNTKTSIHLQQDIKKMPSLPPKKLAIITYPSQSTLQNKKQKFYPNAGMRINIYSHIFTHTNNPSILPIPPPLLKILPQMTRFTISTTFLHQSTHSMHRKYHLPPLNVYIHLHALPQAVDIILAMFSWVLEIGLHTVYSISPMHTPSYITITHS